MKRTISFISTGKHGIFQAWGGSIAVSFGK
jgi:hypothetical protein